MERRLGRRINGCRDGRDERKTRTDVDDRGVRLRHEMVDEGVGKTDRAEQVGGDRRFRIRQITSGLQRLRAHDPGIVDQQVQARMIG